MLKRNKLLRVPEKKGYQQMYSPIHLLNYLRNRKYIINLKYAKVNVLKKGVSFGELALLDPNSRTTATVIAKEFCEFACMDRRQFVDILGAIK